jgi:hypothetical protein
MNPLLYFIFIWSWCSFIAITVLGLQGLWSISIVSPVHLPFSPSSVLSNEALRTESWRNNHSIKVGGDTNSKPVQRQPKNSILTNEIAASWNRNITHDLIPDRVVVNMMTKLWLCSCFRAVNIAHLTRGEVSPWCTVPCSSLPWH